MSADAALVEGPLRGYHHETYVVSLPATSGAARGARWKCREPRSGLLHFDRRCFASEDRLLQALQGRVERIPDVFEAGGVVLQRFVEGVTLGSLHGPGGAVPEALVRQILRTFGQTVAVTARTLAVERRCSADDRPEDGDTAGFLERLVRFTERRVYEQNLPVFQGLFEGLGLDGDAFRRLRGHLTGLGERPFGLLHADLHRENLVVGPDGRLWVIDWELAMVGDPLYDLATHLHLMRYPRWQGRRVAQEWRRTVESARPGSSHAWQRDLGPLLGYKRAQSVFTDAIREACSLHAQPRPAEARIRRSARRLHALLTDAAPPLGLASPPSPARIAAALTRWHHRWAGTPLPGGADSVGSPP
jgi:hypothetical protein